MLQKYRLYIDEVGNSDLESSDNPNHRYLSLTGVILHLDYVERTFHPEMEVFKKKYFHSHPDEPIILHRKEMLSGKHPFDILRNPDIRKEFDKELLDLIAKWDYCVMTVCIDKQKHLNKYNCIAQNPYHFCMKVLLERYVFFLERHSAVGDVMAESRGGKEDITLKEVFEYLFLHGTDYVPAIKLQKCLTSKQLKVKSKLNNIAGLQLTDLLAHPSRNDLLNRSGISGCEIRTFGKDIVEKLKDKYYKNPRTGDVWGYGLKML